MNPPWVYMCSLSWTFLLPPSPSHHSGSSSAPALSTLYHASNLDWWFVSHMIIYMFQCHFPKSSHTCPPLQSPKDCSVSLLLSCIQGYRYHLSKFHIYALVYCIGVFLSGLLILYLFRLCWVFVAVHGLSLVVVSVGYSSCTQASQLQWLLLFWSLGSRVRGLQ